MTAQGILTAASHSAAPAPVVAIPPLMVAWSLALIPAERLLARRSAPDLTSDHPGRSAAPGAATVEEPPEVGEGPARRSVRDRLDRRAGRREEQRTGRAILGVALLLRLLALPMAPVLSNDVYRYVWDGEAVLSGADPYREAPEAPTLADLRGSSPALYAALDHTEVPTVYPPLALGAFAAAAATPAPVPVLKLLLTAADLGLCALLLALAASLGAPARWTIWYAWSPLAVVETAGQGHLEALAVAFAAAAVLLVVRRRLPAAESGPQRGTAFAAPSWVGVAAAAGVLSKLGPLLALPMWARQSRRPRAVLTVAGLLLAAGAAAVVGPGLASGQGSIVPPGLVTYGVEWEFNGPLHEPLWRLLDVTGADAVVKGWLDRLKEVTEEHAFWNRFYPWVYPQLLAKLLLLPILGVAFLRSLVDREPVAGCGRLFGAALLAAATVYPWYLLWVLPWAALARHRPWLLAAALLPLVYLPALVGAAATPPPDGGGGLELFPCLWALVWLPPAALALGSALTSSAGGRWSGAPEVAP